MWVATIASASVVFIVAGQTAPKAGALPEQFRDFVEKKCGFVEPGGRKFSYQVPRSDIEGCLLEVKEVGKSGTGTTREFSFSWSEITTVRVAHTTGAYIVEIDFEHPVPEKRWSLKGSESTPVAGKFETSLVLLYTAHKPEALAVEGCVKRLAEGS